LLHDTRRCDLASRNHVFRTLRLQQPRRPGWSLHCSLTASPNAHESSNLPIYLRLHSLPRPKCTHPRARPITRACLQPGRSLFLTPSPRRQQSSDACSKQHARAAYRSQRARTSARLRLSPGASHALALPPALARHFTTSTTDTHDSPLEADEMVAARVLWRSRPLPAAAAHHSGHKISSFSARNPASRHTGMQPPVHPVTAMAGVQTPASIRESSGGLQQPQCISGRIGIRNCAKLNVSARLQWPHESVSH
jgi:hypothetical protein